MRGAEHRARRIWWCLVHIPNSSYIDPCSFLSISIAVLVICSGEENNAPADFSDSLCGQRDKDRGTKVISGEEVSKQV